MGELRGQVALKMSNYGLLFFLEAVPGDVLLTWPCFLLLVGRGLVFLLFLSFFGISGTVMAQVHDTSPGICSADDFIMI